MNDLLPFLIAIAGVSAISLTCAFASFVEQRQLYSSEVREIQEDVST